MRGDGRVYKRGDTWWIAYYFRGKEVREGGGFDGRGARTEPEAKRKLKARIREIRGDRYLGPEAEKLTVTEVLDAYVDTLRLKGAKAIRSVEYQLKPVRDFFSLARVLEVNPDLVRRFIATRQEEGLANGTINRSIANLRAAFRLAHKEGRLLRVPYFPTLREAPPRTGFFEKAEVEAVVTHLPEPLDEVVLFAFGSGWRRGEILGLRWSDVDRSNGEVRLRDSKNSEPRSLPLAVGDLKEIIDRRWSARVYRRPDGTEAVSEYVFHRNGKPIQSFRRAWEKACEEGKVPGRLFHDLRRSAVRDLVRSGVPESVAMRISGHKTRSIFVRYDVTSDADKRDALKKLAEYRASKPSMSGTVVTMSRKRSN